MDLASDFFIPPGVGEEKSPKLERSNSATRETLLADFRRLPKPLVCRWLGIGERGGERSGPKYTESSGIGVAKFLYVGLSALDGGSEGRSISIKIDGRRR